MSRIQKQFIYIYFGNLNQKTKKMKIKFRDVKLSKANKERLDFINEIIEEYQEEGYILTLRQLYYQLVSRDVIPNKQNEYSKLSTLLKEGRMAGIVDWEAIEDRLRKPDKPSHWKSPKSIIDACLDQYRKDRQKGQDVYLEVWVEKDALSGVLKRVTEKFGVPIMVNRGYSSASAMFDSYERFLKAIQKGQEVKILYLGDFDPSGVDMIRDIKSRIDEFIVGSEILKGEADFGKNKKLYQERFDDYIEQGLLGWEADEIAREQFAEDKAKKFKIVPIALTKEQIREYNPPPNPAKITDPRAKEFIAKHGKTSWEVDALKPEVLNKILKDAIEENIDLDKFEEILQEEEADKEKLEEIKNQL